MSRLFCGPLFIALAALSLSCAGVSGCSAPAQSASGDAAAQAASGNSSGGNIVIGNDSVINGSIVTSSRSVVVINGKVIRDDGDNRLPPRVLEKTVPAAPFENVEIRSDFGSIDLVAADNAAQIAIHAEITLSDGSMSETDRKKYLAGFSVETEASGKTLRIYAKPPADFPKNKGFGAAFRVGVPQNSRLALAAETSNGSVSVRTQTKGNVTARSEFGEVTVIGAGDGASIEARTSNGAVTVKGAKNARQISARSEFGSVTVAECGGVIDAETSNGTVTISGGVPKQVTGKSEFGSVSCLVSSAFPQSVALSTSNGAVSLIVPASASISVMACTSNGSISADGVPGKISGDNFSKSFAGTLDGGASPVHLSTDFGSVSITAR